MAIKTKFLIKAIILWFSIECVSSKDSCEAVNEEPWSYEGRDNGPNAWGQRYPNCNGQQQSPINIDSKMAKRNSRKIALNMKNYDVPVSSAEILNNGHTVMITPTDGTKRTIQIDGRTFTLQQLHFHWNKDASKGSEHAIDGKQYAAEAHFVHSDSSNRIAVVGVLYKAGYFLKYNRAFYPIEAQLSDVPYNGDQTQLRKRLYLEGLLPKHQDKFYRYQGSLTTPGCNEGVVWSVFKHISTISYYQLQKLFQLNAVGRAEASTEACKIRTNVRPLQSLNNRDVILARD